MGSRRTVTGRSRLDGSVATRRWFLLWPLGLLLAAVPLHAAPPQDADPAMAPWFNSLRQPGSGISCCSIADCRPVDYRTVDNHYEAFIEGEWRAVPPDKVLTRADNPTGRAVVCWTKLSGIMCFVRGPET
jgi:hypothetical protein